MTIIDKADDDGGGGGAWCFVPTGELCGHRVGGGCHGGSMKALQEDVGVEHAGKTEGWGSRELQESVRFRWGVLPRPSRPWSNGRTVLLGLAAELWERAKRVDIISGRGMSNELRWFRQVRNCPGGPCTREETRRETTWWFCPLVAAGDA